MSHPAIGRRSIAVAVIAVFSTTVACGTQTKTVEDVQPGAPAVIQQVPYSSADAAERRGRIGTHAPTSADAAERNAQQDTHIGGHPTRADARVPDARIPD